jgi:hypothetical protein
MDFQDMLIVMLQMMLTGGVGGVLIVGHATKDLFIEDEGTPAPNRRFASDYNELMWLAERQRRHLSKEETLRFYQLRQEWSEMHTLLGVGSSPLNAGTLT